jgi:hypothetical protein
MGLATPFGKYQFLPKHVNVNVYILLLNVLYLMGLTTCSCDEKRNGSWFFL